MKYHYSYGRFAYCVIRERRPPAGSARRSRVRPGPVAYTRFERHAPPVRPAGATLVDGGQMPVWEFGWGGISATQQRRCPKRSSATTETLRGVQGQKLCLSTHPQYRWRP